MRMAQSGTRFSITVDEWTSCNSKRYLNVTLHSQEDSYKLGLTSIEGSCDSYKVHSLVEQKLMEYGIKFCHILASTEDGASIMKKYGRLNGIENQFCINHAIHLAVLDTFYKKVSVVNKPVDKIPDSDSSDSDEETENQFNSFRYRCCL